MIIPIRLSLLLLLLLLRQQHAATDSQCLSELQRLCRQQQDAGVQQCEACAGTHAGPLRSAGCTNDEIRHWCSKQLLRYRVLSNQEWPSCCVRPTPGCVGTPTPKNYTLSNLPDFTKWRIETNPGLAFDGKVVSTFYGFGLIPGFSGMGPGGLCADGDWNCTNATAINGGLPQLANLTAHLTLVQQDIEATYPDPNWDGIAAIDFESWKPVFSTDAIEAQAHPYYRQLWIYVNRSIELARQRHPTYTEPQLVAAGAAEFNAASQVFWNATFALLKAIRPRGRFGLYNYPGQDDGCGAACGADSHTRFDNSNLWLYSQLDVLMPSIYARTADSAAYRAFVDVQLMETRRVRDSILQRTGRLLPIYTYTWAEYYIGLAYSWPQLLTAVDVETAFVRPSAVWGAAGSVLWGGRAQSLNRTLCGDGTGSISAFVNTTLGPAVLRASQWADQCAASRCSGHGRCWGGGAVGPEACDCDIGFSGPSCTSPATN